MYYQVVNKERLAEAAKTDERAKSGVPGLDSMLKGGIPKGNLVVLSGVPGSGKSVLSWQFLHEGITKYNENGVYVSLEESDKVVIEGARRFGWDFEELIEQGRLKILPIELYDFDRLQMAVEDAIEYIDAKRVVFDPGVIFRLFFENELDARKRIMALNKMLKRTGCTTIITNEVAFDKMTLLFGMEEYVADGVIMLYHKNVSNKFVRRVGVFKMRNTEILEQLRPMQITNRGIKIMANGQEL